MFNYIKKSKSRLLTVLFMSFLLSSCASIELTKNTISQEFRSNQPCQFYLDGEQKAAGRRVFIDIEDRPYTVTCKPKGYQERVEYINPPYGKYPRSFVFQVSDKLSSSGPKALKASQGFTSNNKVFTKVNEVVDDIVSRMDFSRLDQTPTVSVAVISSEKPSLSSSLQNSFNSRVTRSGLTVTTKKYLSELSKEFEYQNSGLVRAEDRLKYGEMTGANYMIAVTYEINEVENVVVVKAELIDIEKNAMLISDQGLIINKAQYN